jgi:site-specific DNA-methyltransferase (adenine-specific)
MKDYMTVKEAAEILGVNPETLRRWDRAGKLKAKRNPMNNYRLYSVQEIENLKKQIAGD